MVSVHTFELAKEVKGDIFKMWRDKVKNKKKFNSDRNTDYFFTEKGITIQYEKSKFKKYIKIRVNPSRILGGDDIPKLWKITEKNVCRMLRSLETFIDEYFESKYEINSFTLTRIDFTTNIKFNDKELVGDYITVLRSIGKVKGFSPKFEKTSEEFKRKTSYDLSGNSNGVEFTAYDKESEVKDREPEFKREEMRRKAKGILRVEVRLITQKAIHKYTEQDSTINRLVDLIEKHNDIFANIILKVVPFGDFHKKSNAVKMIEENVSKGTIRRKMLQLLELIPKKKSLLLAQRELNYRKIDKVMDEFIKLELSPVTISKRQDIKHLRNLYFYI